jgi:hypothetical protein
VSSDSAGVTERPLAIWTVCSTVFERRSATVLQWPAVQVHTTARHQVSGGRRGRDAWGGAGLGLGQPWGGGWGGDPAPAMNQEPAPV